MPPAGAVNVPAFENCSVWAPPTAVPSTYSSVVHSLTFAVLEKDLDDPTALAADWVARHGRFFTDLFAASVLG